LTAIARFASTWAVLREDAWFRLDTSLGELLALPLARARAIVDAASVPFDDTGATPLAPVDRQEVWAAGVTYRRSRDGRIEESGAESLYDHVYRADRPELFFKAPAWRVVGAGEPVGIRADSGWDVPEAELGLVVNSGAELFGYVIGNDMSSRSIEGENALYLPQAKVYDRSCALGPWIVPAWEAPAPPFGVRLRITRGGETVFAGETSTGELVRSAESLIALLTQAMAFPEGAVLLTGTGIVPTSDFTLAEGDVVTIGIDGLGELENPVVVVGRKEP
jgi:2-dehydro-3-deoxy-D-arabinonate dehydratase